MVRDLLSSPLLCTLLVLSAAAAPAQSTRSEFTFHVYVDPIHGDDYMATCLNPGSNPSGWSTILQTPPMAPGGSHLDPNNTGFRPNGPLQHAPYAFKTLNGNTSVGGTPAYGAVTWINTRMGAASSWPNGIKWVVIHCLPGLYGPTLTTPVDPASGLRYNGETFPIRLPHRVSLQGASALDTTLDARGQIATIVEVFSQGVATHDETFIDSLEIRNARHDPTQCNVSFNRLGSGIAIFGEGSSQITISNCILTGNTVGISIDTDENLGIHRPVIVNNTIAWNDIGLWNGNLNIQQSNMGRGEPRLLNNVFDAGTPGSPTQPLRSCFEGVSWQDLTVSSVQTSGGVVVPQPGVFNAWQTARGNLGGFVCQYKTPGVRPPSPPPGWAPNVDITAYTGTQSGVRGTLFINDVFRNDSATPVLSTHDFRLAPHVSTTAAPPGPYPGSLNPLVNSAIAVGGTDPSGNTILWVTMANGGQVGRAGLPANAEDPPAEYTAWDYDCEGYGNPRVVRKCMIPAGPWGSIDYGADEMGELLVSGYADNTRMFVMPHSCAPSLPQRTSAYFFNVSNPTVTSFPRPNYNLIDGQAFQWYEHKAYPGALPPGCGIGSDDTLSFACGTISAPTAYTNGATPPPGGAAPTRGLLVGNGVPPPNGNAQALPFMRALECDFSPHLIQDVHPFWGAAFSPSLNMTPDVYACLPWYNHINVLPIAVDNPYLFYNPQVGTNPVPSSNLWTIEYHKIDVGTVNPPGTYWIGAGASYLVPGLTVWPAWRWGSCQGGAGGPSTYSVNAWGYGDTGANCPDFVPSTFNYQGTRHNLEVVPGEECPDDPGGVLTLNIQTFLAVSVPPPGPGAVSRGMTTKTLPSMDELRAAIAKAREDYAARRRKP